MIKLIVDKIIQTLTIKQGYRIAFVGDSLTSCEWIHPNWREIVEYVLKNELESKFEDWKIPSWGIRCFNFGFDGSTTKDILEKVNEILEVKPNLIISLMGGNDPTFKIKPEESKNNIEKLLKIFDENKIEVFWMTSLSEMRESNNTEFENYRLATLSIRTANNQVIFDSFSEYSKYDLKGFYTLKTDEYNNIGLKTDPGHPNQLGNAFIAKMVLENCFGINFDPEKFMETILSGEKYPKY